MIKQVFFTLLILLVCTSSLAGDPKPSHSKYVSDRGGGFLIRDKTARYGMTFTVSKKLTRPLYVIVTFDNPADMKQDLVTTLVYKSKGDLIVQSEPFTSAKNGKIYRLKMQMFSDPDHLELVTSHKSKVGFNLTQEVADIVGFDLQ